MNKLLKVASYLESRLAYTNLISCVESFYKIARLKETLDSLNVGDDIKTFILSLPKEQIQYYIAALKKNPSISLQELQSSVQTKLDENSPDKMDPYLSHEYSFTSSLPAPLQKWALKQMRTLRNGKSLKKYQWVADIWGLL
jgi:hypothetical protein